MLVAAQEGAFSRVPDMPRMWIIYLQVVSTSGLFSVWPGRHRKGPRICTSFHGNSRLLVPYRRLHSLTTPHLRCIMRPAALILSAGLALVAQAQVYWWRYPNTDAENLDIEQAPCKASCTLEQLEGYCSALPNCVAVSRCSGDRRA